MGRKQNLEVATAFTYGPRARARLNSSQATTTSRSPGDGAEPESLLGPSSQSYPSSQGEHPETCNSKNSIAETLLPSPSFPPVLLPREEHTTLESGSGYHPSVEDHQDLESDATGGHSQAGIDGWGQSSGNHNAVQYLS